MAQYWLTLRGNLPIVQARSHLNTRLADLRTQFSNTETCANTAHHCQLTEAEIFMPTAAVV